jgi:hypothetical protein
MADEFLTGRDDFARMLAKSTDEELEETTRDYLWLSRHGDVRERHAFAQHRDACIAECNRRAKPEILDRAKKRRVRQDG